MCPKCSKELEKRTCIGKILNTGHITAMIVREAKNISSSVLENCLFKVEYPYAFYSAQNREHYSNESVVSIIRTFPMLDDRDIAFGIHRGQEGC